MPVGEIQHTTEGEIYMLKTYLLSLGCFLDNEYLEEYLLLVEQPSSFSETDYTEDHHIIPRSYYKSDYSKTASTEDIALKDPYNRLVKLSYSDHFYAHWLLYNCTTGKLKSSNAKAVLAMSGRADILNFSKNEILQICYEIKRNSDFYWSLEEDAKLIELYKTGTAEELNMMATILDRTIGAVRGRITHLKLSDRNWTPEEEIWLKLNYENLGKAACARHLNRTLDAVEHKINKLKISNRLWTDEDIAWLIANYASTPTAVCAEFLHRSFKSVEAKASYLNLTKAIRWTASDELWLQENKPQHTWQFCSEYLGRSISSLQQKAAALGILNDYQQKVSKKVRCIETFEIFSSISQACKKYGQGVKHHLQGRNKSVQGLHFEYYNEND